MRIESGKLLHNSGWLHRLTEAAAQLHPQRRRLRRVRCENEAGRQERIDQLAQQYAERATAAAVEGFARNLGVSPEALRRLGVGWDGEAWTFPMSDGAARNPWPVCCGSTAQTSGLLLPRKL